MTKLYCYCENNQIISGPKLLPKYKTGTMELTYLDTLTQEELKKAGWYPWIPGNQRQYDKRKYRLFPYRYCIGDYTTEDYELVPWTEQEYLYFYGEALKNK